MPALTWKYIHLVLNPFPIVLSVVGMAVGLAGWILDKPAWERYGVASLFLAGLSVLPTYYSGISAGDVVSQRTFVTPGLIETHRTWATWTLLAVLADGVFAAFSLRQPEDGRLRRFVLLVGVLTACLIGVTGYYGGRVADSALERPHPAAGGAGGGTPAPAGSLSAPGARDSARTRAGALPDTAAARSANAAGGPDSAGGGAP